MLDKLCESCDLKYSSYCPLCRGEQICPMLMAEKMKEGGEK